MELPVSTPVPALPAREPDISTAGANAIALAILYSLTLATGGGFVFYASFRPVSISPGDPGYFVWLAGFLLLAVIWLLGSPALLIAGLIHLHKTIRLTWRPAIVWIGALTAGTAIGFVNLHQYDLLVTSYPRDADGSPLGPSRFAPGAPYWQALIATAGLLAVGAVMIALITAWARKGTTADRPVTAA